MPSRFDYVSPEDRPWVARLQLCTIAVGVSVLIALVALVAIEQPGDAPAVSASAAVASVVCSRVSACGCQSADSTA